MEGEAAVILLAATTRTEGESERRLERQGTCVPPVLVDLEIAKDV